MAPLESLTELEEIDLYDNRISKVKGLRNLSKLRYLSHTNYMGKNS